MKIQAAHDISKFISACSTVTSVLLIVTGPGVQRYVRTYVNHRNRAWYHWFSDVYMYVSIVLVYALIILEGRGGGGGGHVVSLYDGYVGCLQRVCLCMHIVLA